MQDLLGSQLEMTIGVEEPASRRPRAKVSVNEEVGIKEVVSCLAKSSNVVSCWRWPRERF
jgi:hypothetical protein